jgi:hypothetical protein
MWRAKFALKVIVLLGQWWQLDRSDRSRVRPIDDAAKLIG